MGVWEYGGVGGVFPPILPHTQTPTLSQTTTTLPDLVSRAFYAMLFATRAALRTRELDPSTHKGVFTLFNEHFIQSNELPRHLSRTLRRTMDVRQLADYAEDEAGFGEEEATSILEDAQHFVEQLRRYLT